MVHYLNFDDRCNMAGTYNGAPASFRVCVQDSTSGCTYSTGGDLERGDTRSRVRRTIATRRATGTRYG